MKQIKIKNIGPIKNGFNENEGFLDIDKITVFIGNQATGKSTVAKLISTMTWLEKALYQEEIKKSEVEKNSNFVKKYCGYQGLESYFLPKTEIEYKGNKFSFSFYNGKLKVNEVSKNNNYLVPKIMYVPAERNFLSVVENPRKLENLPKPLYTFLTEFDDSQRNLSESLSLPTNNIKFEYQKQNKIPYIIGNDYKIKLSEASSGIQSLLPVFLVSRYLALSINKKEKASIKKISYEKREKFLREINKFLDNDELKETALEMLASKYRNSCFINIIEEIEQNLFPKSQKTLLYEILKFANYTIGNELILTTHSPYIINYLTLAIKGHSVLQKIKKTADKKKTKEKLNDIVPLVACVDSKNVKIYELDEKGNIKKLSDYDGIPSDDNYLNTSLYNTNESFDNLLELEDEL